MKAPFPWYGGKSRAAPLIWRAFGAVANYIEPFAGSLAVMLARPHEPKVETVNDLDAYISNFWRAVAADPDGVAHHADWPVSEVDLHARHQWLVDHREELKQRMLSDPDAFDAKAAGWWVWGVCQWIGSGWCSKPSWKQRPHLSQGGEGLLNRVGPRRPNLVNAHGHGLLALEKKRPVLSRPTRGLYTHLPRIGGPERCLLKKPRTQTSIGVHAEPSAIQETLRELATRLRRVRIICGDWKRVLGRSTLGIDTRHGMTPTGILLDPPYSHEVRGARLYAEDDADLSSAVRAWALKHGEHPELRIALCGYEGEHSMPASWRCVAWKSKSGFANAERERLWFSPHCLPVDDQQSLFERTVGT